MIGAVTHLKVQAAEVIVHVNVNRSLRRVLFNVPQVHIDFGVLPHSSLVCAWRITHQQSAAHCIAILITDDLRPIAQRENVSFFLSPTAAAEC